MKRHRGDRCFFGVQERKKKDSNCVGIIIIIKKKLPTYDILL